MKKYGLLLTIFLFSSIVFASNDTDKKTNEPNITQKKRTKEIHNKLFYKHTKKNLFF